MKFQEFSIRQLQALSWWCRNSPYAGCDAVICDGAVRSGKTVCMGVSFFAWCFYRFDQQSFALCGKTIRSLRRNLVTPLLPILKELGFTVHGRAGENMLEVTQRGRTNRFYLFGGKDEGASAMIQGITLAGILLDEVALMPRSFVEQALARCSVEGSKFWFNCNPEHPRPWFYEEWIQKRDEKNAYYLHFRMEDNPSLSEKMIERYRGLYSGSFYQRFIEGRWVAAEGLVYPFMEEPDRFLPPPEGPFEEFIVSCDYGTVNPASFGLWGRKEGVWYRLKEYYYDSKRDGGPKTDEEHYQGLVSLLGARRPRCVIVDPSAASFQEVIRRHGEYRVIPAKNNVLDGIRQVSTALKEGTVEICRPCKDSIREFGLYRWDPAGNKDCPVKENDHAMDDIRYFVATALWDEQEEFIVFANRRTGGF